MTNSNPIHTLILATAVVWSGHTLAEPTAQHLMPAMQGVYKHRFPNGTIDGSERWMSEDVVEIVPIDDRHLYLRAELDFANGHVCSISGPAVYERGVFVMHSPTGPEPDDGQCALRISLTAKDLVLDDRDPGTGRALCHNYCGARGSLSDYRIARSKRREIRYMPRLKASREYRQALAKLQSAATR